MGILDDLKHKAGELGEKAKEGLDVAKDKAGDLVDDVRERLGHDEGDGDHAPTGESEDIGPDSSSTDAVQPGYVTGEDAGSTGSTDEAGSEPDAGEATVGTDDDGATSTDTDAPDETEVEPTDSTAVSGTASVTEPATLDEGTDDAPLEPVAKDVDPYEEPLSESIGSELSDADREALAGVVEDSGTDEDA